MSDPGESTRRRLSAGLVLAPPGAVPAAPAAVPVQGPQPVKAPKAMARSSVLAAQDDHDLLLWMRDEIFHETRGEHRHEAYGALIRAVYDAWPQIRPAAVSEVHLMRSEGHARPRRG